MILPLSTHANIQGGEISFADQQVRPLPMGAYAVTNTQVRRQLIDSVHQQVYVVFPAEFPAPQPPFPGPPHPENPR